MLLKEYTMIRFAAMNDLEMMLSAQKDLKAEIETLTASTAQNITGLKRPKKVPEVDEAKLKNLKLQLTALGMKIAAEQSKAAKPSA
jgi:hypothetical protein